MSFQDAEKFWQVYLNTHWTNTPIKWENVSFEPSKDNNGNPKPYISLLVRETLPAGGGDITLGSDNPFYRWAGITLLSVFVPESVGLGLALQYVDQLKGIFRMLVAVVGATDIASSSVDNSFNSTTTDFLTRGVVSGMQLAIASAANNGVFTVVSVTQRKVIVSTNVVTSVAGAAFSLHGFKVFRYGNSGLIRTRMSFMNNVGVTNGWQQLNLHVPFIRDGQE